jgi:hypothetical protein
VFVWAFLNSSHHAFSVQFFLVIEECEFSLLFYGETGD